jgi:hypothetical protein
MRPIVETLCAAFGGETGLVGRVLRNSTPGAGEPWQQHALAAKIAELSLIGKRMNCSLRFAFCLHAIVCMRALTSAGNRKRLSRPRMPRHVLP